MPQTRYYHHGRYYRLAPPMPLLPPLSLVPAVDPSKHSQLILGVKSDDDDTVERRWKTKKDKEFRWMVQYIGKSLTGENIADIKFLCREHIYPSEVLRKPLKGPRLMAILEKQRLLAENSLFFLQTLLYYIARPDLYEIVFKFRSQRQNNFRKKGVEIIYDMKQPHERGLSLSTDIKAFRRKLKPRSRLNNVDIPAMEKKLAALRAQMQTKIPDRVDRSRANSSLSSIPRSETSESEWSDQSTTLENDSYDQSQRGNNGGALKMSLDFKMGNNVSQLDSDTVSLKNRTEEVHFPDINSKNVNAVEVNDKDMADNEYEDDFEDDVKDEKLASNRSELPKSQLALFNKSSNFSDLKGRQTCTDDDIIDRVHDVNKIRRTGRDGLGSKLSTRPETVRTNLKPKVPRKIKILSERYRRDSPARRMKNVSKKKRTSKTCRQIRSTRTIPTYAPESINFLPDIYDKCARRHGTVTHAKVKKK